MRNVQMSKSIELMTKPKLRAEHMNRVELLSQVGELERVPKTKYSTTKQVAEFYGVEPQAISYVTGTNRSEVFEAGVIKVKHQTLKDGLSHLCQAPKKWSDLRSKLGIASSITNLYPKQAVLLIGFILEKSPVADKLRELAIRQADLFEPNVESTVAITAPTIEGTILVPNNAILTDVIEPVVIQSVQKQHNDMQATVVETKGDEPLVIDSRDVAEMVGKEHDQLMRSIRTYTEHLDSAKLQSANFFIPSTYKNSQNREMPCYLLTKKGCDMVANKMTGSKGTVFTAIYVTRFEEMENELKNQALVPVASYMIGDPIERAKLWIQEEEQRMLLVETVETQVKVIEYKDEIIKSQAQVIDEKEQQIMKATAIMFEQQEMIADNINEKYARAYEMSRGYSPREMRNQINNMIQVNFSNSSKDGWNKLYNAYNLKYNVNVMQMKKAYEKKNHTNITIIEFVELDTIMISQLYDLALGLLGNKGAFEKYYKK